MALASAYLFAQPTSLAIESAKHERFWLYINDKPQNPNPVESLCITNLYPDWDYTLRIVIDNHRHSEMTTVISLHHGQNNYSLNCEQKSGQIRINATNRPINATLTHDLNQPPQHGHHNNNQYPPQGNPPQGNHQYPPQGNPPQFPPQGNHQYPPKGNPPQFPPQGNHQYPPQGNPPQFPPQGNPQTQPQHGNHSHNKPPVPPVAEPVPAPMPCSDADFADAKRTIEKADFEDTKLTIAKQIVSSELMTAKQLAEIANLFDFEHTKLEFLKFAYPYCFDQNKYYMVNDVFDFSSSVDELNKFINK